MLLLYIYVYLILFISVRTVIVKGLAPVDPECVDMVGKAHVFCEGNEVWDCMLNQVRTQQTE